MESTGSGKIQLGRPPEAGAITIARLVERAREGHIRVPHFQRGLKWRSENVLALLDSIRKGLPIGSLLFWKRKASGGPTTLGPLRLNVPERHEASWVVDGQQRLVALTVSLSRNLPLPVYLEDPYVVYFDPVCESFVAPPASGDVPEHWVALPHLLDATELSEFVHDWTFGKDKRLRSILFETGTRIRQFEVPVYTVETDDESVLREIFFRVNKSGKPLAWEDVYDALYGQEFGEPLTTLAELSNYLSELGFGEFESRALTPIVVAMRGLDVTRTLGEHLEKDRAALKDAASEAAEVLPKVIGFLRRARIPHLRLLPRMFVLETLARFFFLHRSPSERSLVLLTRWLWRILSSIGRFEERTFRRHSVALVKDDEALSVQGLLKQAQTFQEYQVVLKAAYDVRAARTRLALLSLSLLGPRDIMTGEVIEVGDLKLDSLPTLVSGQRDNANRLLHPTKPKLRNLVGDLLNGVWLDSDENILQSHALNTQIAIEFQSGNYEKFLELRRRLMVKPILDMAQWNPPDRDRPSIEYLLSVDGE